MADEENLNIRISELPETNVVDKDSDYLPVVKESTLYTSGYQTFKVTPAKLLAEAAEYTAGDHIAISSDNEISATYKAGTNITIDADGTISATGGGSGSTVEVTQIQTTGTKIATITVDSVGTDLYAPNGGGGASAFEDLTDVDIDSSTLANGQVPVYNSNSAKWENGTISGGSGHTILDDEGTSLTQRDDLQFKGAYSEDDSTNDKTVVNVARTMTLAEFEQLTDDEKAGFINVKDETSGSDDKFQPVIYSEEEREIGVWIDGKPLYQKTVVIAGTSLTAGGTNRINHGISNVDYIQLVNGTYTFGDGGDKLPLPFADNYKPVTESAVVIEAINSGNIRIGVGSNYSGNVSPNTVWVTVQYTKTTDQAGSGQWTPQGVPAVHYSENEQVIGTWVDGSTLYEKTQYGGISITDADTWYDTSITGVDKAVMVSGTLLRSGEEVGLGTFNSRWIVRNNTVKISLSDLSGDTWSLMSITIRYTKLST